MLAIILSLTSVVVAESVDQTVRGSRDIRRVLDLAPLGVIPEIQDASDRPPATLAYGDSDRLRGGG
jgi:capsular polysaccharide biosynthesis protein